MSGGGETKRRLAAFGLVAFIFLLVAWLSAGSAGYPLGVGASARAGNLHILLHGAWGDDGNGSRTCGLRSDKYALAGTDLYAHDHTDKHSNAYSDPNIHTD